jgi:septum site-determining protein MinD
VGTVIVITSGKGGTGKTSLTGGLAAALALSGQRTLCIDCDVGLRNLDITLGMTDTAFMDLSDVIEGRCGLDQAMAPHPTIPGLSLLTAPLTLSPDFPREEGLGGLLAEARGKLDYILIDSPAGLGTGFHLAVQHADRAIVVAMSDPASLRDAQRVVSQLADMDTIHLVMNRVSPRLLRRMGATIDDAMDTAGLPLLGLVPDDPRVTLAAGKGRPLLELSRRGAARSYRNIARRLQGEEVPLRRMTLL